MSGHSHWAGIKHRKGLNDAKRAKVFTKLAKPIVIAARDGGGNPDTNFKLRLAIEKAREFNMPKDNIEKAVKRGTGELKGEEIAEIIYEATAPGGVMMLLKTTTDNRNRTVSEIKSLLTKAGGKFAEAGSVAWNFEPAGSITIDPKDRNREEIELLAIDSGARDIKIDGDQMIIFTETKDLQKIEETLASSELKILSSELIFIPKSTVSAEEKFKKAYDSLLEALYEQEDVEEIFDNIE